MLQPLSPPHKEHPLFHCDDLEDRPLLILYGGGGVFMACQCCIIELPSLDLNIISQPLLHHCSCTLINNRKKVDFGFNCFIVLIVHLFGRKQLILHVSAEM